MSCTHTIKLTLLAVVLFVSQTASATLPPQYQNLNDLNVMIEFLKQHELVLSTLESIDLENYTIHYNKGCTVYFNRKQVQKPQGWVGPANSLEFKRSTCDLE